MLSGISKHHFGAYPALLFLVILAGQQSCSASKNSTVDCAPSSCGNIHNIRYPFRLSTDPNSCGNKKYELTCEDNRPALYLKNKTVKYHVQAIHYSNFTIRVVDADVQKDDCFSIPRHSLTVDNFDDKDYSLAYYTSTFVFMSCPNRIPSPPNYTVDASSCKNGSNLFNSTSNISSPSSQNYSYVFIVSFYYYSSYDLGDISDLCHVNLMYPASFTFDQPKTWTNISYIDVHDSIVYGFYLSWSGGCCDFLEENHCKLDEADINEYCGFSGGPIQIAIGFLTNRMLSYHAVDVWPLNRYLEAGWIYYYQSSITVRRLEFRYSKNGYYIRKTISSDALSIVIVLLITLLVLLLALIELIAYYIDWEQSVSSVGVNLHLRSKTIAHRNLKRRRDR